MAGQMAIEIGVFATVTVLVSKLNATALAGHQIALTIVSTTFMMPLGISSAAAVRVGFALGRGDRHAAARAGWTALGLGASVMSAAAIVLLTMPEWIARLFTPEAAVIATAATILRVAAFFQLFDGLQIVVTGSLRGAGDTRTPMVCHSDRILGDRTAAGCDVVFRPRAGRGRIMDRTLSRIDRDRSGADGVLVAHSARMVGPRLR